MEEARERKERSDAHTRFYGTIVKRQGGRYALCLAPDKKEVTECGPFPDFLSARDALLGMNPPHTPVPSVAFNRIVEARRRHGVGSG